MRREKSRIGALSTIRVYLRELSAVYRRYTDVELDKKLRNHFVAIAKLEITPKFGLRVEPKHKKVLNLAGFIYLAYFRWVRDRTRFKIGLDRIDDALARIFLMWTQPTAAEEAPLLVRTHSSTVVTTAVISMADCVRDQAGIGCYSRSKSTKAGCRHGRTGISPGLAAILGQKG